MDMPIGSAEISCLSAAIPATGAKPDSDLAHNSPARTSLTKKPSRRANHARHDHEAIPALQHLMPGASGTCTPDWTPGDREGLACGVADGIPDARCFFSEWQLRFAGICVAILREVVWRWDGLGGEGGSCNYLVS